MAFQSSAQRPTAPDTNTKGFVEAAGFINVTLNLPGQPPMKLPSLALQGDEAKHGSLAKWLNEDPTRVTKIRDYLTLDYKENIKTAKVLDFSKIA